MNEYLLSVTENTLSNIHDQIVNKLIIENLLTKGAVTIEEAQYFNKIAEKVISEASDTIIPEPERVQEIVESTLKESVKDQYLTEGEGKVLVDPESGDQYLYDPDTGSLTPMNDAADVVADDATQEPVTDADSDVDDGGEAVPVETNENTVVDGTVEKTKKEEAKTELNESELLIETLLNKVKEL